MEKAENGEIREVTANIWEDRKHHLWFPISFTKYTVGNGRLYVNSGFLSSREDECLLYRITDITLYRSLPQRIFGTGTKVQKAGGIPYEEKIKYNFSQLSVWRILRSLRR